MRVLTFTVARNEADLIPYFVRHYRRFSDVTVFDDASDDDTARVARAEGATVLPVHGAGGPDIEHRIIGVKNYAWKPVRRRYDWVIAVDADEFLYHERLVRALHNARKRGATVLEPCGYQMVSDNPPCKEGLITDEIRRGAPCWLYSKRCCFDPKRIIEINFAVGAHYAHPLGKVQILTYPGLKLLHYHFIGVDRVVARYANRVRWQTNTHVPAGWRDYKETREQVQETFNELNAKATEVI